MPAYYIGEHKITDAAAFDDYLRQVVPMIERFGGRYLTRAGSHEMLEGEWQPNRVVIIEFPDMASIKAWYRSPDYQPLIAMRRRIASDVMICGGRLVIGPNSQGSSRSTQPGQCCHAIEFIHSYARGRCRGHGEHRPRDRRCLDWPIFRQRPDHGKR